MPGSSISRSTRIGEWTTLLGGSRIAFARDGTIFMTTGATSTNAAQDPNSDYGKVLPEVYTIGHRDQLGLAIHPETGAVFSNEDGPNGGEAPARIVAHRIRAAHPRRPPGSRRPPVRAHRRRRRSLAADRANVEVGQSGTDPELISALYLPTYPFPRTATTVITIPAHVITPALATGRYRITGLRAAVFDASGSQCLAYSTTSPIAISTTASPALNATSSVSPSATRPKATELSSSTSAEGQGTNPPLAPSAIRLPSVTSPSGT